jgi:hypothetical protein
MLPVWDKHHRLGVSEFPALFTTVVERKQAGPGCSSRICGWFHGVRAGAVAGSLLHLQSGFVRRGDGRLDGVQAPVGPTFRAREPV